MIYLSGRLKVREIGKRPDIGLMIGYREGSLSHGRTHLSKTQWAADNGCFTNPNLNVDGYLAWLKSLSEFQITCLFATAPDVVGDCKETWKRSKDVLPQIRALGYQAALVAQDGMENYPIQWDAFDVLFIGGTTEWKLSEGAYWLVAEAKRQGKWVHMGRVNSRRRIRIAVLAGCDSVDGTQLCFAPDKRLKQLNGWLDELQRQPFLFSQDVDLQCWEWALV
jgi:hypothetical protein